MIKKKKTIIFIKIILFSFELIKMKKMKKKEKQEKILEYILYLYF